MKPGQIAQLQELRRCYFARDTFGEFAMVWVPYQLAMELNGYTMKLDKVEKAILRRLWHLYRHQIAAMRKNRKD